MNKEEVLKYIEEIDNVSFVELKRKFEIDGEYEWRVKASKNIILWVGLSKKFLEVMFDLLKEKKIYFKPCSWIVYLADGGGLSIPLVKGKYNYKNPHWLPIIFRPNKFLISEKKGVQEAINIGRKKVGFK